MTIEKIVIIEKDYHKWKGLWLLKKIVLIWKINACHKINSVVI